MGMTRKRWSIALTALCVSTGLLLPVLPLRAADLPNIRWGYVLPPVAEIAGIFTTKPELLKHWNKSYTFEPKFVRGSPVLVTALAAGEIDVANLGFSTFNQAVVNAGLSDLRVIGDEAEDGFHGHFSSQIRVRKDSGINKIEDLKGKVVATIAIGSAADLLTRYTLRTHGLELNKDYTYLETAFPTMHVAISSQRTALQWWISWRTSCA
jgi:sulfonate transport system substrate-binding protein